MSENRQFVKPMPRIADHTPDEVASEPFGYITGIVRGNIVRAPEFSYTQNGYAVLKVNLIYNKWIKGSGENRSTKAVSVRATFWREDAERIQELLGRATNKDGQRTPIGAAVKVEFGDAEVFASKWRDKNSDEEVISGTLEVTGVDLHLMLRDGGSLTANSAGGGRNDEESGYIPF